MRAALTRLSLLGLVLGCEDPFPEPLAAPVIHAARPAHAAPGEAVTLLGRRFGVQGAHDRIWLGGEPVPVETWSDTALRVQVPQTLRRGTFDFVIRTGEQVGPPFPFEVRPLAPPGE